MTDRASAMAAALALCVGIPLSVSGESPAALSQRADRINPSAAGPVAQAQPSRGSSAGSKGAPPVAALAQLSFARVSSVTQKWTEKGGTEWTFDRPNLSLHLVWESPYAEKYIWRWQVAVRPFPADASLPPPGLVREEQLSAHPAWFTIDLGSFPPLGKARETQSKGARGDQTIDFHIRLIPTLGGKVAGPPSNVIVAHYVPGSGEQSSKTIKDAIQKDAEKKAQQAQLAEAAKIYKVDVLSFTPATFADPNLWGCVIVVKNPHFNSSLHPLGVYKPGARYCGATYSGASHQAKSVWDYVTGWVKAYEVMSDFYDDVKKEVASQFAHNLCGTVGNPPDCQKYAQQLAGAAINVGLTAAGVPPTLPDLDELAKGKAVDAAVGVSCSAVESSGGTCTSELREVFAKSYRAGLEKLQRQLAKVTSEPGCGNAKDAHEHGREPLPCFTDYPGTEVRPATGAVYQPPVASVRVTRTKPSRGFAPQECQLKASLSLRNDVAKGTQIESYYPRLPETVHLAGEPFVEAHGPIPPLAAGRSTDLTLSFAGIKPYKFSTTKPYTVHDGWCHLYVGGQGMLTVWSSCPASSYSASDDARRPIQIPKEGRYCVF